MGRQGRKRKGMGEMVCEGNREGRSRDLNARLETKRLGRLTLRPCVDRVLRRGRRFTQKADEHGTLWIIVLVHAGIRIPF